MSTEFGGRAVMTSVDHLNGTDRIAEALIKCPDLHDGSIIVNVQGDEPCVESEIFRTLIELFKRLRSRDGHCSGLITDEADMKDPSIPKCVLIRNNALYFSRAVIPAALRDHKSSLSPYRHLRLSP